MATCFSLGSTHVLAGAVDPGPPAHQQKEVPDSTKHGDFLEPQPAENGDMTPANPTDMQNDRTTGDMQNGATDNMQNDGATTRQPSKATSGQQKGKANATTKKDGRSKPKGKNTTNTPTDGGVDVNQR